ncbi:CheR family methyltransferase [Devosia sp.]|uniref:CheR family methyltransferase n=1 Tax=Devosia sp. TaxID=1871048 RepID=UPI002F0834E4
MMPLESAASDFAESKAPPADRLREEDFSRLAALLSSQTGIKLPAAKRLMVESRLRRRVRELGLASLAEYGRTLFEEDGLAHELVHVIDAVTTNKTDFFREADHFDCLANRIVPLLLAGRGEGRLSPLKIWSAASSTGAEAYTIAMVMSDLAALNNSLRFAILGTDVSTAALAAAERAVYPAEMASPVPRDMQDRYLMRGRDAHARQQVRIVPELRRLVRFERLNLMDRAYPFDRDVDVIFLRNVLIYFEKATQEEVVSRLLSHLRPGGFLILGHSESMIGTSMRLPQFAQGVFRK